MTLTEYFAKYSTGPERVTQAAFAERIGVSQGMVWQWLNDRRRVAAENVIPIEQATNGEVTRCELRPDLYPPEQTRRRGKAQSLRV